MDHPSIPTRGIPMENTLVCTTGTCGQCLRCQFMATSKAAVATMLAERRGIEALSNLRAQALKTVADSLEDESKAKAGLLQLVDMTPDEALALLFPPKLELDHGN